MTRCRCFYGFQAMTDNVHVETFSLIINAFVPDVEEQTRLFGEIECGKCCIGHDPPSTTPLTPVSCRPLTISEGCLDSALASDSTDLCRPARRICDRARYLPIVRFGVIGLPEAGGFPLRSDNRTRPHDARPGGARRLCRPTLSSSAPADSSSCRPRRRFRGGQHRARVPDRGLARLALWT